MKKNYQAWQVNIDDFFKLSNEIDRLKFLINFAVLAPSTHNNQPWQFLINNSDILIFPNPKRELPVADPDHRLLFFSLGCAVENIVIAADYYSYQTRVEYFPFDKDGVIARISFKTIPSKASDQKNHLIFAIPKRRTNRTKYTTQIPKKEILSSLQGLAIDSASVSLVLDLNTQENIAEILINSRVESFNNKFFRCELADYKRTNLTNSPIGMPAFTMGFNTLLSFVAPFFIRHINVMKILKKKEENLLKKHTPVFAFIVIQEDSTVDWLAAGRLFERVALEAERRSIQTAISGIHPKAREQIKKILKTPFFPQVFFRMGYADKTPHHSPRLSAKDVIIDKIS